MKEMYKFRLPLVFLFFLLFVKVSSCNAQEKEVQKENQQWVHYFGQFKFSDKWLWLYDGGFRWRENFQERSHGIVRSGIGYLLSPDVRIAAGLAGSVYYAADRPDRIEVRPYQDFAYTPSFGNVKSQHRIRLEERFFRKIEDGELSNSQSFNFRFRYSVMFQIPIVKLPALNPEAKLLLSLGDEIFINAGQEIIHNVFDQNRMLIGPVLQLNKTLSLNCLYQSQFRATSAGGKYRQIDIIWVTLRQNLQRQGKE